MTGKKYLALLFTAAIALAGGMMLNHGRKVWLQARASLDWVVAPATVGRFAFRRIPGQRGEAPAEMAYTYEADGKTYQGERICFGPATSRLIPKQVVAGEQITIHYDPSDPSNCVWRKGHTGRNQGLMVAGLVVALFGMATSISIVCRR